MNAPDTVGGPSPAASSSSEPPAKELAMGDAGIMEGLLTMMMFQKVQEFAREQREEY